MTHRPHSLYSAPTAIASSDSHCHVILARLRQNSVSALLYIAEYAMVEMCRP